VIAENAVLADILLLDHEIERCYRACSVESWGTGGRREYGIRPVMPGVDILLA